MPPKNISIITYAQIDAERAVLNDALKKIINSKDFIQGASFNVIFSITHRSDNNSFRDDLKDNNCLIFMGDFYRPKGVNANRRFDPEKFTSVVEEAKFKKDNIYIRTKSTDLPDDFIWKHRCTYEDDLHATLKDFLLDVAYAYLEQPRPDETRVDNKDETKLSPLSKLKQNNEKSWNTKSTSAIEEQEALIKNNKLAFDNSIKELEDQLKALQNTSTQSIQDYKESSFETITLRVNELKEQNKNEIINFKNAVIAELSQEKSRELWDARAKQYRKESLKWHKYLIRTLVVMPSILLALTGLFLLVPNYTPDNPSIFFTILGTKVFIVTCMFWSIRHVYRGYSSRLHIMYDAEERVKMLDTYIRLIEEGGIKTERANEIVLASIFRPTNDGIIKEDKSTLDLTNTIELIRKSGTS